MASETSTCHGLSGLTVSIAVRLAMNNIARVPMGGAAILDDVTTGGKHF